MSPKAIEARLEVMRQLYRLMLSLCEIKRVGPYRHNVKREGER